jgi:hypothetical protein
MTAESTVGAPTCYLGSGLHSKSPTTRSLFMSSICMFTVNVYKLNENKLLPIKLMCIRA